jgi:phospholipid/cholesterol/gamma-HCH transport system permease protein
MIQSLGRYILLTTFKFSKARKIFGVLGRGNARNGFGRYWLPGYYHDHICIYWCRGNYSNSFPVNSPLIPKSVVGGITRDSMVLEFSPTISSLVLAGRIGSSMASQIGTMRVTEQIDALEIMGVNAPGYLISPKVIAGVTMFPLLVIVSILLGFIGGYVACFTSSEVTTDDFMIGLPDGFNPVIITVCMVKAVVFGFIITTICSYQGFYTSGGALEVGQAATRGVVFSCVMILMFDLIISRLFL